MRILFWLLQFVCLLWLFDNIAKLAPGIDFGWYIIVPLIVYSVLNYFEGQYVESQKRIK